MNNHYECMRYACQHEPRKRECGLSIVVDAESGARVTYLLSTAQGQQHTTVRVYGRYDYIVFQVFVT